MFGYILTNKWVIGGFSFLTVFAVACVFWYQYDTAPYRKAAAEAKKLLRLSEIPQKVDTKSEVTDVSADSRTPTAEKPITQDSIESMVKNTVREETNSNLTEQISNTSNAQEHLSPHGFGAFPDVPEEFISSVWAPSWVEAEITGRAAAEREIELIERVMVKLWKNGHTTIESGFFQNGKVYVHYKNRAYVTYDTMIHPRTGEEVRFLTSWSSGSLPSPFENNMPNPQNPFALLDAINEVPSNAELIDLNKEDPGIDPYTFLGFNN